MRARGTAATLSLQCLFPLLVLDLASYPHHPDGAIGHWLDLLHPQRVTLLSNCICKPDFPHGPACEQWGTL